MPHELAASPIHITYVQDTTALEADLYKYDIRILDATTFAYSGKFSGQSFHRSGSANILRKNVMGYIVCAHISTHVVKFRNHNFLLLKNHAPQIFLLISTPSYTLLIHVSWHTPDILCARSN